jgi:uncharacterized protein (DUF2147 family)
MRPAIIDRALLLAITSAAVIVADPQLLAAQSRKTVDVSGIWYDDTGKGAVELKPCGNSICGYIVWLKEPNDAKGAPLTDGYNPDAAKRAQPICGLQVIGELKSQGDGTWDGGWVYDPKVGKSYDVYMEPASAKTLTVTGYKGVKFLSKTFTWTRAPSDLPRCGVVTEAIAPTAPGPVPAASVPRVRAPRP